MAPKQCPSLQLDTPESASGGALQGGRVGLQTPDQEDLWASGMTGNGPRDFSVLSSSTASALFLF